MQRPAQDLLAARARVDSSPVVAGGRVYVGSGDGRLYVLPVFWHVAQRRWLDPTRPLAKAVVSDAVAAGGRQWSVAGTPAAPGAPD